MRALLIIFTTILLASPSSAIQLTMIGAGAPKITTYRPCETQVVVYDARPEMGVSFEVGKTAIEALDAIDVRIARVVLEMNLMEPTEKSGVYDSAYLNKWDKFVDECRVRGVCLDVAIGMDVFLKTTTDSEAVINRVTRFTTDMATRYPSVAYWEIGDYFFPAFRSDSPRAQEGKLCAQLLRELYPAVKSANPATHIVLSPEHSNDFLKGVYEDYGKQFFDIAIAYTDSERFSNIAIETRKIMAANGDESKPLWCVYTDGFERAKLEAAFHVNNAGGLYQKILVGKTGPSQESAWLPDARINSAITARPRSSTNVFVPTKKPMVPLGYNYKEVEGGIEIQHVVVDSLVPTVIQLMYAPESLPVKPGAKPAPKTSGAPTPNYWDP